MGLGERPGEEWARHTSWAEILEPHGLAQALDPAQRDDPLGAAGQEGAHHQRDHEPRLASDLLYVFTTSTVFEAQTSVTKFGAYAVLDHGGDYSAAARELRREGFGGRWGAEQRRWISRRSAWPRRRPQRPLSPFLPKSPRPPSRRTCSTSRALWGELQRYIVSTAPRPQPILALGAAISAVGTLAGRRVQSETGLRTNVYIAGLVESGGGKEWPRQAIRRALGTVNLDRMAATDDVTSDAAINGALLSHPSCLMMFDELGHLLREVREQPNGVVKVLLKLYGCRIYYGKTYAIDRRTGRKGDDYVVHQPCLSIFGTSVPHNFWGALSTDEVENGLLGRLLVFESETPDPPFQRVPAGAQEPPAPLVEALERWRPGLNYRVHLAQSASELPPSVFTCPETAEARKVFDALEATSRARARELRTADQPALASLYTRLHAHGIKLALIRAAGRGAPDHMEIDGDDARWGAELATWCVGHIVRRVEADVGDSEHDHRVKEVRSFLRGKGTVEMQRFARRFRKWDSRTRRDVLETLHDAGMVAITEAARKPGASGPARKLLRLLAA